VFCGVYAAKAGAAGAIVAGGYGLTGYQLQVIGAGVLFGAALGVMDINPFLLRCRFQGMA